MCSLRKKIVFTFIHIPVAYTGSISKSNFQVDEWMDVLGLPLLALSMARKTLQNFKNVKDGKVYENKKKKKHSRSSVFLIFSHRSFPNTSTCLFILSFSLPGCWLMMVSVCSDYNPSHFPKSVWKHAVCGDSSCPGQTQPKRLHPGWVKSSPEQNRWLQGLLN